MQRGLLYKPLDSGQVRCQLCQRRCRTAPGRTGYWQTRLDEQGTLYTLVRDHVSSVAVDPIEKKPLFDSYPTSQVLSLGTFGCNFRCIHCQNCTISDARLEALAAWLVRDLRQLTPWHVTRFLPYLELTHLPPTPLETLGTASEIGREEGLHFVYVRNVPGHDAESTYCYHSGQLLVQRSAYQTRTIGVQDGTREHCGTDLNITQTWPFLIAQITIVWHRRVQLSGPPASQGAAGLGGRG